MKRTLALLILTILVFSLACATSANTDARNQLLTLFNESYIAGEYTAESYAAYQAAMTEAVRLYDTVTATEEELTAAAEHLQQAINDLKPLLNRETLLSYVETLESYIYSVRHTFPNGMMERMIAARDNFNNLYQSPELTAETLLSAEQTHETLLSDIELNAVEMEGVNNFGEDPELVVPVDYMEEEEEKTAGAVTKIRVQLVYLAAGCILLGFVVLIIYLATSKKYNQTTPKEKK